MENILWNMFANIKNGQLSRRKVISQKRKKICESFLKVLWNERFISGYVIDKKNPKKLKIFLKYYKNKPAINSLKTISKPSRRIFYSTNQIWKIDSKKSFLILSTNRGLKSLIECKKLNVGGEPFLLIN